MGVPLKQQVVEEERSFGTAHVQFVPSRVHVYVLYIYLIFFIKRAYVKIKKKRMALT